MHECHRPAGRLVELSADQASDPICGTWIDFRLGEDPPTISIPLTARPSNTDAVLRPFGGVAPWTFVAQVLP